MSETLLSLVGVGKSFKEVDALTHVDLEIKSGQVIGLVGGNGAGKTTLLRLMAGVMEPSKGTILFQEKPVSSMRSKLGSCPRVNWPVFEIDCMGKHPLPFTNIRNR